MRPEKTGSHAREGQDRHPLVSVITVVRNCRNTVGQSVASVLGQTYGNIQYIVIDGASSDGTLEVLRAHQKAIDVLISEPDGGIYHAMNKGIANAAGEYIIFLNADDWYEPQAIERLVCAALSSGVDVVHADARTVDGAGNEVGRIAAWLHDGLYTKGMPLRHETMLVKKAVYDRLGGYDESYRIIADYVFVTKLYSHSCSFFHVAEPLLNFRMEGVSSSSAPLLLQERKRFYASLFPFLEGADLMAISADKRGLRRLWMLVRYRNRSGLFARSLVCNIRNPILRSGLLRVSGFGALKKPS